MINQPLYFLNTHPDQISTQLNLSLLHQYQGFVQVNKIVDIPDFSTLLIMGYALESLPLLKQERSDLRIGVVDPRPTFVHQPVGCDFILANGIEMMDWYCRFTSNIFFYPIYPQLDRLGAPKRSSSSSSIILGYHGNKIHLLEMFPRITLALEALTHYFSVELWMMYNIKQLGKWAKNVPQGVKLRHLQWTEDGYSLYMSQVDIGIVPALLPNLDENQEPSDHLLNQHPTDYTLTFKSTSNLGRAFVFYQYGIPVVADMIPSALQVMKNVEEGFICYSTAAWFDALYRLCASVDLREQIGKKMLERFESHYAVKPTHQRLSSFLQEIEDDIPTPFASDIVQTKYSWRTKWQGLFQNIRQRLL
jgi:glycosyltransferase involved in cell wall biosynthesis